MIAAPANSEPDFYGRSAKIGPRRELTLRIETWPKGKMKFGGGEIVTLRFGAIENFEEIQKLFANLPADGLHYLKQLSKSTARRRAVEMEFDRAGKRVRIVADKIALNRPPVLLDVPLRGARSFALKARKC
jgi:hypothetical protein